MTQQDTDKNSKYNYVNPNSKFFKLFLIYDIFMVFIIVFNLFCLGMNFFLMSNIGEWFFNTIHLYSVLEFYRSYLHPWVITTEAWFIIFLIVELAIRWLLSIIQKHHARWWFFPFIHWYEIVAIIPHFRFLRLFRAGIIAYRLHELGYKVVPDSIRLKAIFYYRVVMEELSDRVVITVIDGIKHELDTSSSHKKIIHDLVDHHRQLFTVTLSSMLQESLAKALQQQQPIITQKVGHIVNQAIEDTPELTQLLRLIPIVGSRIEQQIQSIGQRLGENITAGLIEPFTVGSFERPNENYLLIAEKVSQLNIDNQYLEELVESVVYESLEAIRKQVKVKQWQQTLNEYDQLDKKTV
ncbi:MULTISPECIES: preprotein translocase subunit SecA [Acinetobacter]|uniref:Preprotein translocase subunit SecA n=1 Tax=Acinetobacter junii TaxID=40215 RepID=A0A365PMX9_ACIJU|nr:MULTISPECIES: preprotein translocase subunit SecA [Acinetobacter]RBA38139.1 preprotein translocase subunit SecA [Acinetobacter junii]RBA42576.1 preprotein translocase subunit SecA [Acinetobacter junii]RBA50118.1 preprotein translocase subunit SecA [Acinetobacter junii]WLF73340.1 preprotein translocase subunit SecA [Acinetobacter junii]